MFPENSQIAFFIKESPIWISGFTVVKKVALGVKHSVTGWQDFLNSAKAYKKIINA